MRRKATPEDSAGLCSKLVSHHAQSLLSIGYRRPLELTDVPAGAACHDPDKKYAEFERLWRDEKARATAEGRPASLFKTMWRTLRRDWLWSGLVFTLSLIIFTFTPTLVNWTIVYVKEIGDGVEHTVADGALIVAGLFLLPFFEGFLRAHAARMANNVGMDIRSIFLKAVFTNSLRLTSTAKQGSSTGNLMNLMSTDAQRFTRIMMSFHQMWTAVPLMLVLIGLLMRILGVIPVLCATLLMILYWPASLPLGLAQMRVQREKLVFSDKRVNLFNEIIQGIKVVKYYAWEAAFKKRVMDARELEAAKLRLFAYLKAATIPVALSVPTLATVVSFVVYSAIEGTVPAAEDAFEALTLFQILRLPYTIMPLGIANLVQARTSLKRLSTFLTMDKLPTTAARDAATATCATAPTAEVPVRIPNASFAWGKDQAPILRNIDLHVNKGELVAVVGAVGAGKSSLLAACLGELTEMRAAGGDKEDMVPVEVSQHFCYGSVAFVPQTAFVQNASLRDNVLFGNSLDKDRYRAALSASALAQDLNILGNGDRTEIGEKGITLSGGQRQRVSLARALYDDADVYLFDDPLSAVDAHVGAHIFDRLIVKGCRGKTRVLVTNQLQYLDTPEVSRIMVVAEGRAVQMGTYAELMAVDGPFLSLVRSQDHTAGEEGEEDGEDEEKGAEGKADDAARGRSRSRSSSASRSRSRSASDARARAGSSSAGDVAKGTLVETETTQRGDVAWSTYFAYFAAVGSWPALVIVLLAALVTELAQAMVGAWLALWVSNALEESTAFYTMVYLGIGLFMVVIVVVRSVIWAWCSIQAATALHTLALNTILRCPMVFFETTPTGRILNRFSKDLNDCDLRMPQVTEFLVMTMSRLVVIFVYISIVTPLFLVVGIPLVIAYATMRDFYRRSSRELQRIDAVSRSPIFAQYSETLAGLDSVRAYNAGDRLSKAFADATRTNNNVLGSTVNANAWLAIRLATMGAVVTASAGLFGVLAGSSVNAALVGFAVTFSFTVPLNLQFAVRFGAEAEAQMNGVERLLEYSELPVERPAELSSDRSLPSPWPSEGVIQVKDLQLRYRDGLDMVLKGVNFDVPAGARIGIVGRTGSGKSSLFTCFFRLVEFGDFGGSITIDGVDVSTVGLDTLRRNISIIPQDPVLFVGTLRNNLDPFHKHTDAQLMQAIRRCHLQRLVDANGLDMAVSEGGASLSVGERQLVCLGRALLSNSRVLLLDEATAAVDPETDELVMQTIHTEFEGHTILIIAHRLNTVIDSDLVLVMDAGNVAEYDAPEVLLRNPAGAFRALVQQVGSAGQAWIREACGEAGPAVFARTPKSAKADRVDAGADVGAAASKGATTDGATTSDVDVAVDEA